MTVTNGKQVSLEYTLKIEDGRVIESNIGKEPLSYVHGTGQVIPGLEKGLEGAHTGETRIFEVKPEDAYGPFNEKALLQVPVANLPEHLRKVGARVELRTEDGRQGNSMVAQIQGATAILNLNHPLAGRNLTFEVRILSVDAAAQ